MTQILGIAEALRCSSAAMVERSPGPTPRRGMTRFGRPYMLGFLAVLMPVVLAGCGFVSYEDVSSEPKYSMHVGARYRTTEDMEIYRISMERNYGPSPSIYEIVQSPGFGGPEVLSRTDFPEGSTMRILSVKRCKDCYLDEEPRMHVVVRLDSDRRFDDWEVQVDLGLLSSHMQEVAEAGSPN